MNKQELIERIDKLPYFESPIADTVTVNRKWILKSIEQLDEPKKATVPQFVADYIRYAIENDWDFQDLFKHIEDEGDEELRRWVYHERNQETFATAWINGYDIEEEKRYRVKMKGIEGHNSYLKYNKNLKQWYFGSLFIYNNDVDTSTYHTRKELEKAGFGEVFDSPLFEVEEVE